ncbi:MAG: NAD-dependent epimerase/dehydratase family protein, partial [Deltaproteobacteria bacterium]|nr:NAD-dependent epimerase/dehydratase family protein [Deltaproteobacteria bacterium]
MKILITGGLGFVGTQLSIRLLETGHDVTLLDHSPEPADYTPSRAAYVSADTSVSGKWQEEVAKQDAIINLAGASIFSRWNDETKQLIRDSRILTTRNVVQALPEDKK